VAAGGKDAAVDATGLPATIRAVVSSPGRFDWFTVRNTLVAHGSRNHVHAADMPRSIVLFALIAAVGCRTHAQTACSALGVTFAGTGAVVVATNEQARPAGITLISVGTYVLLMSAILHATARDAPSSAVPAYAASGNSCSPCEPTANSSAASPSVSPEPMHPRTGYDRTGAYAGRAENGNYYDRTGAYAGRRDNDRYYDRTGSFAGRVDQDRYYDRTGSFAGRVDDSGAMYDKTGAAAGRIDASGNIYDKTGAYAGRVEGGCDDACRRETAARILLEQ
jgi:hypothetical protein